jgi:hypothetical protein
MDRADLKAAILGADDLPREPVDVPWDLGGPKLFVRGLTASEKDAWVARTMPGGEFAWTNNLTAELVCATLVDEDGERVFADEDAAALGKKGAATLSALFAVAMRLSGLSEDTEEQVEADFANGQSLASTTA